LDVRAPGHVGADRDLAKLGGHLLDARVEVGQHQLRAVGGEPTGARRAAPAHWLRAWRGEPRAARRADPARGARDEDRSPVQLPHRRTPYSGVYTEVLDDIPEGERTCLGTSSPRARSPIPSDSRNPASRCPPRSRSTAAATSCAAAPAS